MLQDAPTHALRLYSQTMMSSQARPLNAALTSIAGMTLQFTMSGCRLGETPGRKL